MGDKCVPGHNYERPLAQNAALTGYRGHPDRRMEDK